MAGETKERDITFEGYAGDGSGRGYTAPGYGSGRGNVYTDPTAPTNPTPTNPNSPDDIPREPLNTLTPLLPNGQPVPVFGQYVKPNRDTFVYLEPEKLQIYRPLNEQIVVKAGSPVKYLGEYAAIKDGNIMRVTALLVQVYVYKVPTNMWIDADVNWTFGVYPTEVRDTDGTVIQTPKPAATDSRIDTGDGSIYIGNTKISNWFIIGAIGLFLLTRKRKRK